jgi:hypothetical protein
MKVIHEVFFNQKNMKRYRQLIQEQRTLIQQYLQVKK